jgi:small subunit ribosomal protein S6
MDARKHIYETVFVLHPELTEEEVEADIQNIVGVLENGGGEILRIDRGGKRRLAYQVQKQRYGYYNLMHFRAEPEALPPLDRTYRLSERILRYLTVRFDKEEQLTGFTRLAEDEGRDEDREERRRGGRRSEPVRPAVKNVEAPEAVESVEAPSTDEDTTPEVAAVHEPSEESAERISEGTG